VSGYVAITFDDAMSWEALLWKASEAVRASDGRASAEFAKGASAIASAQMAALQAVDAGDPAANDRRWDPGQLAELREAVRVQDATCTVELVAGGRLDRVIERLEDYPVPPGVALVEGLELRLEDKRCARVLRVIAQGRAALVRAKVWADLRSEEDF
jgi:hypothetical protein